jgi:hypothetical protein
MTDIDQLLSALMDAVPSPVSLLSQLALKVRKKRLDDAADILRRRMARGRPHKFREDAAASALFDFLRAAEEGAAHKNLEIMADLIANGLDEQGLTEAEISHLLRVVKDLAYDEMRALAALLRAQAAFVMPPDLNEPPTKFWVVATIYDAAWLELAGSGHGEPPDWVVGTFGALMRTGLLYTDSAWEGMKYAGTPLLARLASLVDLGSFPKPK